MDRWVLPLVLLAAANAHADPPFYPRGTATNQAIGGLNQNFLDQTTRQRDRLTTTLTPEKCASGETLTAAHYNNGYTYGGTCTAVSTSTAGGTLVSTETVVTTAISGARVMGIALVEVGTLTLVTANHPVILSWYAPAITYNTTRCSLNFLIDGNYVDTYNAGSPMATWLSPSGTPDVPVTISYVTTVSLSSGSHKFALTMDNTNCTFNCGANQSCKFRIQDATTVGPTGATGATGSAGTSTAAVNASMIGDGSVATPLGVSFSSITLANLNGTVPTGQINSSTITTKFDTLGLSTAALSVSSEAFRVWQGTISPVIDASKVWLGTASPQIEISRVWQGTISPVIELSRVWQGTISPVIELSRIWQGTASVNLAGLNASTTTLSASTVSIVSSLNLFKSTAGPLVDTIGISTGNLFIIKASTGIETTITKMTALATITPALTAASTLTVLGNAFSVGTASFSVAGGSATVGYLLTAQNVKVNSIASGTQCLQADGSGNISGTGSACAGGASNAVLSATQTFTGADTFTSTIVVGNQSYGIVLNYKSVIKGGWSIVGSTRTYGWASSSFTNLNPNYIHRFHYNCSLDSGGAGNGLALQFGSAVGLDGGSKYAYLYGERNSGSGGGDTTQDSDTKILLFGNNVTAAGNIYIGEEFEISFSSDNTRAFIYGVGNMNDKLPGAWNNQAMTTSGNYLGNGTNVIDRMRFYYTSGNATCRMIYIEALVPGVDPP